MKNYKEYQKAYRESHRKEFRDYSKKYYLNNKEKIRATDRERYLSNKIYYKKLRQKQNLNRKYGISKETYELLIKEQDNQCEICKIIFTDKILPCVDHNHQTGEVRGLLCRKCNLGLSVIEDKDFLEKSIQYLNKSVK